MFLRQLAHQVVPNGLAVRLATGRDWLDRQSFRAYSARHQYGARELTVHIADSTARRWYDVDWPAPAEIQFLSERGRLNGNAVVFDIGAHQGVVALMLADRLGPGGRVVALEPMRHNVAIAARNLSTNGETRVTLLHAAASDRAGVVRMASRLNAQVALNSRGDVVTAVTVDELAAAHGAPDVLFVDVEGYEIHVLSGATSVLRDIRPDLFIEVHSGVGLEQFGTAKDLLALIPPDYSIFVSPTSPASFVPLDADSKHLLAKHSLLIALASRRTLTQ